MRKEGYSGGGGGDYSEQSAFFSLSPMSVLIIDGELIPSEVTSLLALPSHTHTHTHTHTHSIPSTYTPTTADGRC